MINTKHCSRTQAEIEDLIKGEGDPKSRALLIVLNSINSSIIANTATTVAVSEKLDDHLTRFDSHSKEQDAIINRGRGATKMLSIVLTAVQAIVIAICSILYSDLQDIHSAIATDRIEHQRFLDHISEAKK